MQVDATFALLETTGQLIRLRAVALVHHGGAFVALVPVRVEILGKRACYPCACSIHAEGTAQLHGDFVEERVLRRRSNLLFLPNSLDYRRHVLQRGRLRLGLLFLLARRLLCL